MINRKGQGMGRKQLTGVALALCVVVFSLWAGFGTANAQPKAPKLDKVTLQLKWVTQSQFAGYYAAKALGYYKAFGLDVTLKLGGPGHRSASTGCRASSPPATRARTSRTSRRCSPAPA